MGCQAVAVCTGITACAAGLGLVPEQSHMPCPYMPPPRVASIVGSCHIAPMLPERARSSHSTISCWCTGMPVRLQTRARRSRRLSAAVCSSQACSQQALLQHSSLEYVPCCTALERLRRRYKARPASCLAESPLGLPIRLAGSCIAKRRQFHGDLRETLPSLQQVARYLQSAWTTLAASNIKLPWAGMLNPSVCQAAFAAGHASSTAQSVEGWRTACICTRLPSACTSTSSWATEACLGAGSGLCCRSSTCGQLCCRLLRLSVGKTAFQDASRSVQQPGGVLFWVLVPVKSKCNASRSVQQPGFWVLVPVKSKCNPGRSVRNML